MKHIKVFVMVQNVIVDEKEFAVESAAQTFADNKQDEGFKVRMVFE